jgi:DNA-binding transcriptional ArsR family regulator
MAAPHIEIPDKSTRYIIYDRETNSPVMNIPNIDIAGRVIVPRKLKVSSYFWKMNLTRIIQLGLPQSTLLFLIEDILSQMSNDSVVRGKKRKGIPQSFREIALALDKPPSTVSNHMKILVEHDVIRIYRKHYYVNPAHAFRFSMSKIPEHIIETFPDLIWEGTPVVC